MKRCQQIRGGAGHIVAGDGLAERVLPRAGQGQFAFAALEHRTIWVRDRSAQHER